MQQPFPSEPVIVNGTLLNNMWRILFKPETLTHNDRRDLENLMALLRSSAQTAQDE